MTAPLKPFPDSFDPFAIHSFTNGSGLIPQPPKPSKYPTFIPSPRSPLALSPPYSELSTNTPTSPIRTPQPLHRPANTGLSRSPPSSAQPIFVPFRKDTSSPELVLKKRAPVTKNAGTQTPGNTTSQKQ